MHARTNLSWLSVKWMLTLLVLAYFQTSFADTAPPSAKIQKVSFSGSGCKKNSANATISPDFQEVSVLFDKYSVEIGEGSTQPEKVRSNLFCNLNLDLQVPKGWQISLASADFRGFVALPENTFGYFQLFFLNKHRQYKMLNQSVFLGPLLEDLLIHEDFQIKPYSRCSDGHIKVSLFSRIGLEFMEKSGPREFSQIVLDSVDGAVNAVLPLKWKKCKG